MINRDEFKLLIKSFYRNYGNTEEIEQILIMNFGNDAIKKIKEFYRQNNYQNSLNYLDVLYDKLNKRRND